MPSTLRLRLSGEVDATSLYAFRVLFGSVLAVSSARFMWNGWVTRLFGERTFFFKYWGFSWVSPLSLSGMYGVYTALCVLGIAIALGFHYRIAIVLFFLLFSYAELIDVTNYLNHYYLVSLLTLLMACFPLSAGFSLDARQGRVVRSETIPAYVLWLFRFQVATVYLGAALAKCGSDWLLHGWPLNAWLGSQVDVPVVGALLHTPHVALIASWAGMLHDFAVPPLLLWRRTRPYAYAALLSFHAITCTWFNIGIFPVLMPLAATLFFDPSWPRRLFRLLHPGLQAPPHVGGQAAPVSRPLLAALGLYCAFQVLVPFRTHFYGGNVLWHEQGMRWSWRVMLRDKRGSVMFRVALADGREVRVPPRRYLTGEQEREMAGQPDLILQLAQHVGRDFAAQGRAPRAVYAESLVSLNGRVPVPMIDPRTNLLTVADGLGAADYILPAPQGLPPSLHASPHLAWNSR
jgi:hypothetical protein